MILPDESLHVCYILLHILKGVTDLVGHRLERLEATVREKEQLAEGLHLIDFEQLKIENQSLTEKIEERNEELLKLKRKITMTVQVSFVQCVSHCLCRLPVRRGCL